MIDISGSMRGKLMDDTKNALSVALAKLDLDDSFSIIAFNGEIYQFSKSMKLVSKDAVERALQTSISRGVSDTSREGPMF